MTKKKDLINIIASGISDEDWTSMKLAVESKKTFQNSKAIQERQREAIQFANWILKHTVTPHTDEEGLFCWKFSIDDEEELLSSGELYTIFKTKPL